MNQDLIKHIDRLIRQRPAAKTALARFREVACLIDPTAPDVRPVNLKDENRDIKREEGFPLFSKEDLPIDFDAASHVLKKFLEHLGKAERDDREGLKKALEKAETEPQWSGDIFMAILKQDEEALARMAEAVDLNPEALFFLGQVAMQPSIHLLRETLTEEIDKTGWDHGYCPLCGSQPDMAYFEKTGKRHLHCGLCGEEWPFPRIRCPFCDNEDQETLGYFEVEEEEGFRVYFCRKCHRYLKTIDKKAFEEVAPLEIENLATIHLDLLAQENGFK